MLFLNSNYLTFSRQEHKEKMKRGKREGTINYRISQCGFLFGLRVEFQCVDSSLRSFLALQPNNQSSS